MSILAKGLGVAKAPLGDVTLLGIKWLNDEKDMEFQLLLHSSYGDFPKNITLLAEWATNVKINLDYGNKRMGAPFSWKFDLSKNEKGVYDALLDFGGTPNGYISFVCNEISINT